MHLYFMRHGRTNYNELGLCNDDPSRDVHLSAGGIAQAEEAALALRAAGIERVIVSPLPRTHQTAEIVNRFHSAPIEVNEQIIDLHSGFDGKPVADYFAAIAHDPLHTRPNNGESLLDHKQRIEGFIAWLKKQPEESILVVAHEETLRVFVAHFEGNIPDDKLRDIHIGNCEFKHYVFDR